MESARSGFWTVPLQRMRFDAQSPVPNGNYIQLAQVDQYGGRSVLSYNDPNRIYEFSISQPRIRLNGTCKITNEFEPY